MSESGNYEKQSIILLKSHPGASRGIMTGASPPTWRPARFRPPSTKRLRRDDYFCWEVSTSTLHSPLPADLQPSALNHRILSGGIPRGKMSSDAGVWSTAFIICGSLWWQKKKKKKKSFGSLWSSCKDLQQLPEKPEKCAKTNECDRSVTLWCSLDSRCAPQ